MNFGSDLKIVTLISAHTSLVYSKLPLAKYLLGFPVSKKAEEASEKLFQ